MSEVLLPDRDNTFAAFQYRADGRMVVAPGLSGAAMGAATMMLKLVGFDKPVQIYIDADNVQVPLNRSAQRMDIATQARAMKQSLDAEPNNQLARDAIVKWAHSSGFFSIWMKVFEDDSAMKRALLDAFPGTRGSGCFDGLDSDLVRPAPNPDGLAHGGKV